MYTQIENKEEWEKEFGENANDFNSGMSLGVYENVRWKNFIRKWMTHQKKMIREEITNLGSKNFDRQNVLSLPSLNIKEDE